MNHKHFLQLAKQCSKQSTYSVHTRVQVGCIAVYKGSVLAKGCNTNRTHTDQMRYNHLRFKSGNEYYPHKLHAEINVLSKIKYLDIDFSKVVLYIYREYTDGTPAMARPCKSCEGAIRSLGITNIVYTTDGGFAFEKYV